MTRGAILYSNGITGFQQPNGGGKDRFVLCLLCSNWTKESDTILDEIGLSLGVTSLESGYWIGTDYISIHWSEYGKRFEVLTELLSRGFSFQVQTKTQPLFKPKHRVCTLEKLEERIIKQTEKMIELGIIRLVNRNLCDEWNWSTEKGKEYARLLSKEFDSNNMEHDSENYYQWEIFTIHPYDPLTLCNLTNQ